MIRKSSLEFTLLLFLSMLIVPPGPAVSEAPPGMPSRPLGRTGHEVSLFSLGGQAVIERPGQEKKAVEIINRAIDLGVNYIDTAPAYGGGVSETYIGMVMEKRRDEVFLATKSHDYSYDGTMRLVRESLGRLKTGRIDLYQHHNVGNLRQLERITAEDGALKAFIELKEQNVVSHIGITSHSPLVLLKALELDVYDCMLITLNPSGAHMADRQYLEEFLRKARDKGVGVVAMKLVGRGALLRRAKIDELIRYALSFPASSALIGISETWQVEENARVVREFKEMGEAEKRALEARFR